MENQPTLSNLEESETSSQAKVITSDPRQFSYNPICCPPNSPLIELREAQIIEENKLSCPPNSPLIELREAQIIEENKLNFNWTLQKIKVVPYPQPEFHINNENLQSRQGGRGAEGQGGRGAEEAGG